MDRYREDDDDFLEFVDIVEEVAEAANMQPIPKRYLRDVQNPVQFYEEVEFRRRYRFSKQTVVNTILPLVLEDLRKVNNRGLPFPPMIQVLTCLRFYATGNFQTVCGDLRGISQQSVSRIIRRVSIKYAECVPRFVHFPRTENEQRQNILRFSQIAGFPGVAACLDGTHVPVANPGGDHGEVYRNRKGYFSMNVQVAVGPRMEILDIVVRHPGSTHDSVIFDRSALRVLFEERQVHGLLLGDNGYPCRRYLLTAVIRPGNPREVRYNTAHIRTRNIVERVFGVWKRKFPCLRRCLSTKINTSQAIICALAVLHNIGIRQNDFVEELNLDADIMPIENAANNQLGLIYRNYFIARHF